MRKTKSLIFLLSLLLILSNNAFSQVSPVVNFEMSGGYIKQVDGGPFIPSNTSITYTEKIKNNPTSFQWIFEGGDPATATISPVEVIYRAKGKYDFSLRAANTDGTDELSYQDFVQVGDKAGIWNVPRNQPADVVHNIPGGAGYLTGENSDDLILFAEKFAAPRTNCGEVASVNIMFEKISSSDENLIVAIYSTGADGMPSKAITQTELNVDNIIGGQYTTVVFDKPAAVTQGFFVVISAPQKSELAIKTTPFDVGDNTAYVCKETLSGSIWHSVTDYTGSNLSMNIVPMFTYSELAVDKNRIQFNDKPLHTDVTVSSNIHWEIITSEPWIKITSITGNTFSVSCSQNRLEYRKGYITVMGGGLSRTIIVEQSIAAPLNLTATKDGEHNVDLEWEKDFAISTDIFEDFESHTPFAIASAGQFDWKYIDGDGLDTYELSGIDFPQAGQPMSFMIFAPSQTAPPMVEDQIQAHSGDKFLACFSSPSGVVNDWFISPKLNFGREFKFSFWAKTYTGTDMERFRVMYSTSDNGDFVELSNIPYVEAPLVWTRFEYTVPADAKYVAINCISDNAFLLMIDDVFIGRGNSPARLKTHSEIQSDKTKAYIPQNPSNRILKWHNGIPSVDLISIGASTMEAAIKFEADDLARYLGYKLTYVDMHVKATGNYVLKVYINGEIIAYQPLENIVAGQMNRVQLRAPIPIDSNIDELMISYEVSGYTQFPATRDTGENTTDRGGLIKLDGTWYNLPHAGIPSGNWMIAGIAVKEEKDADVSYKIYRNGTYIATTDNTYYKDEMVKEGGDICYTVSAVQKNESNLEASRSNQACVELKYLLKIKANDAERFFGEENPDVTGKYTIAGFLGSDTDAMLSKKPSVSIDPLIYYMYLETGVYKDAVVVADAEDASEKYRFVYQHGALTIKAPNTDASLARVKINGTEYSEVPEYYAIDCDYKGDEAKIEVIPNDPKASVQLISESSNIRIFENIITVTADKPFRQKVVFSITAEDGITKEEFSVVIEKYFGFKDIVVTRWNNTLTVINNPANNGGYRFVAFKWYRNGAEISTSQSYTAGAEVNDNDKYYVEVTTDKGEILRSCTSGIRLKSLAVKAYPNPVNRGEVVYVDADLEDSLLKNAIIEVYNSSGVKVQEVRVAERITPVTLRSNSGTYIFIFRNDQGYTKELKIIKQ